MYRGSTLAGLVLVVLALGGPPTPVVLRLPVLAAASPHVFALPVRVISPRTDENGETALLNLINQARVSNGIPPLMPHATMQSAARAHGREMFALGYLTHFAQDGRSPRDRVLGLGVGVRLIGENLAYAADARAAHEALMASEDHRRNILFPQYRLIGVGVIDGGADGVIVVEDFSDEGIAYHLSRWWEHPVDHSDARRGADHRRTGARTGR